MNRRSFDLRSNLGKVFLSDTFFGGQALVELLVTIGLAAILIPAIFTGVIASREGKPQQEQRMGATTLLKETEQAVRSIKDAGWNNIATFSATPLHPIIAGNKWALIPGSENINSLTRQVVVDNVYRDANNNIVSSGGTLDPSTKKATITISWSLPKSSNASSVMYLTRNGNSILNQTTKTEFNAGTNNGVLIQDTTGTGIADDGQIQLSLNNSNWCSPSASIKGTLSLPNSGNVISAVTSSTAGGGDYAYIGAGNGSPASSFMHIGITDPQPPAEPTPVPSIIGLYNSSDQVNALSVANGYAFLATNATSNQIKIVRLSDNTLYKTINLGSGKAARGIFVSNNVLYATSADKIYLYNVSDLNDIEQLPTTKIHGGGLGEQIVVVGTKAYVSVSDSNLSLQIFTINVGGSLDDWSLSYWSSNKINWVAKSTGLVVNATGTRAYVAFTSTDIPSGFYIVDASSKGNNSTLGVYDAGGMQPKGIALGTSDIAILVGTDGSEQYQVINGLSNDTINKCGGMTVTNGAGGVATVTQTDTNVYSYLISGDTNNQFKIIEGGSGGGASSTGLFDSATIEASSSSVFNRFSATVNQPANTTVEMQVAVAQAPPPGTSCSGATYTFVGPNGNTSSYFTAVNGLISGQIPFGNFPPSYQNPAKCMRFRASLSTNNSNFTPYLYDITLNYSP